MDRVVWLLGGLFGVALVAVSGNTTRLQIATRRDEIEVSRLIGATDRFIRRPFLYQGALQGFAGAIVAWGVVSFAVYAVNQNLTELGDLYGTSIGLQGLSVVSIACVALSSAALGWVGAYQAVRRSLKKIDTNI
jgi:cell division transport system permease protein